MKLSLLAATANYRAGRTDKAVKSMEAASKALPQSATSAAERAGLNLLLGELDMAAARARQAVEPNRETQRDTSSWVRAASGLAIRPRLRNSMPKVAREAPFLPLAVSGLAQRLFQSMPSCTSPGRAALPSLVAQRSRFGPLTMR